MKHTKILATIGPRTQSLESLRDLFNAGMNAVRLNFSHGDHEFHGKTITNARQLESELGVYIPVILDTKGPEIRTGKLEDGQTISLEAGKSIIVTTQEILGNQTKIHINYPTLTQDTEIGGSIMIADGLLQLRIEKKISDTELECIIVDGGKLGERKNVNLPNVKVQLPALSEKDKDDLAFGCSQQVDYIAASFIRKASDVQEVREFLDNHGGKYIKIIAKIENQEGIDNYEDILTLTDGIMVARGDLGTDIALERIPEVQKMMIRRCNEEGKLAVTATQMLDSMIYNPRPTRAEVTDVANAIIDGTDVVMLSGETANGDYPVQAVTMMSKICRETESYHHTAGRKHQREEQGQASVTASIALGAVDIASTLHAPCILAASLGGATIRNLRQHNPKMPILAITPHLQVARQVMLIKGVIAHLQENINSYEEFYTLSIALAQDKKLAQTDDYIVLTGGGSIGMIGTTDMIKIIKL